VGDRLIITCTCQNYPAQHPMHTNMSCDTTSYYLVLLYYTRLYLIMTSSHHITSHHITSHHTTSHHIVSHHITSHHITSYHITSYHITSHHITSHDITSHHITSHHIVSHHITSYHITSQIHVFLGCVGRGRWMGERISKLHRDFSRKTEGTNNVHYKEPIL
jgi:hypothetical protein